MTSEISKFKIDLSEKFSHLSHAPIVEAAVAIQADVTAAWEEPLILAAATSLLPEYPKKLLQRQRLQQIQGLTTDNPSISRSDLGHFGLQCQSEDARHVVQLNRTGLVFSRLAPYESWSHFQQELMRLWDVFLKIGKPMDVQQVSLRFINRFTLPSGDLDFEDYLLSPPQPPIGPGVPFAAFFHQDGFAIPGGLYIINRVRTIHPQPPSSAALIIDIDVLGKGPFSVNSSLLGERLAEIDVGLKAA